MRWILFWTTFIILIFPKFGLSDSTSVIRILKFNPLELFNNFIYESSTIQFSYETNIYENYTINQDIGYIFHNNLEPSIITINLDGLSGLILETEIRRYSPNNNISGKYFSIHFLYKYLDAKDSHTVFDSTSTQKPWIGYYSKEKYSIYRNEYGIHLKVGYQEKIKNNFITDYSIGIGLRNISSRNNSKHFIGHIEYDFPYKKPFHTDSKSFFSITIGFRIGWDFSH